MLNAVAVGWLREDAQIVTAGKATFLSAKVDTKEQGFGSRSNEVFTRTIEAVMFGSKIHEMVPLLTQGVMVSVVGKPEAKGYTGRDGKIYGSLSIKGSITPVAFDPPPQPEPAQAPESLPSDDVPY